MILFQMRTSAAAPRRHSIPSSALFALLLLPVAAGAQAPGPVRFERFTLANGLEVVLAPDHAAQVVSVDLWYRVGSRDEPPAKAGLARLFERLMFAGSAHVPIDGLAQLVDQAGGQVSAQVDEDDSRFSEVVPSNYLERVLWLEADRMRGIVISDTTFAASRAALVNELDQQVDAQPYTGAIMDAVAALYDSTGCPGYGHRGAGRARTIARLTTDDARAFFARYYQPNNASLVIAGDIDTAATRSLVTRWFAGIPRGPQAPAPACQATFSPGPLRRDVRAPAGTRPAVGFFYRLPGHDHADTPALALLGLILGQGRGSRIGSLLSGDSSGIVATQGGVLGDRLGPGAFGLFAVAGPGSGPDSLSARLEAQAAWAASDSLTQADLDRAKAIYLATAVSRRERYLDIAEALHHALRYHGDPAAVNTEVAAVLGVTLADLRRVAATWLAPANALTLMVTPEGTS